MTRLLPALPPTWPRPFMRLDATEEPDRAIVRVEAAESVSADQTRCSSVDPCGP
jgi:hypothetical protein